MSSSEPAGHPESGAACVCERAHAATAHLEAAIAESLQPVAELGSALERMFAALATCKPLLLGEDGSGRPIQALEPIAQCHAQLARELQACIVSLQSHDRVLQHLAQARARLRGACSFAHGGPGGMEDAPLRGTVELF